MENNFKEKDLYEVPTAKIVDVKGEGIMVDSPTFSGFGKELNW